jgi:dihydroorotase
MMGDQKLTCALTLRAGQVVYDPTGFTMPEWPNAPEPYWHIRR